jgi:hypothetical protein
MFDELLDPDIEDLMPIDPMDPDTIFEGSLARTQPFTLTCDGAPVPYDGYYQPNGNNVTWPLGPSLVVIPDDFVATSAMCSLMLKDNIVDKDGNPVPMDQRGPYTWTVEGLAIVATDPEPGGAEISADGAIVISFNAPLDDTSVDAADVVVETAAGAPVAGAIVSVEGSDIVVYGPIVDDAGTPGDPSDDFQTWAAGDYVVTVPTGATFADIRGGTLTTAEDLVIEFTVL